MSYKWFGGRRGHRKRTWVNTVIKYTCGLRGRRGPGDQWPVWPNIHRSDAALSKQHVVQEEAWVQMLQEKNKKKITMNHNEKKPRKRNEP